MLTPGAGNPLANYTERGAYMRSVSKRGALVVALMTGVGLVSVSPGVASAAPAGSSGTTSNVIVVLHNQHDDLTISKGKQSARVTANRHDESGAIGAARSHGARNLHGFDTVNAYVATVTAAQQSAIAADPAVAAIYPDLPITKAPAPDREKGTATAGKPVPPTNSTTCSTDSSKPLLEPEALQVTNTAFQNPSTPQAQNLYTGAGVKVAFLADGAGHQQPGLHPGQRFARLRRLPGLLRRGPQCAQQRSRGVR